MKTESGWYAVSLSGGVEVGTSNGTRLLGEEIVVWRDASGAPHVWEDRCPHRGMRLSFGFVRSDRIACLYHGWQYGTEGRCLYIPAHPQINVPPSITVVRHSSYEELGMIFAHFGEATDPLPIPSGAIGGDVVPVRSVYVDCPAEVLLDGFATAGLPAFNRDLAEDDAVCGLHQEASMVVRSRRRGDLVETLIGGIQPITRDRSALHLVVFGTPEIYRGRGQKHFAAFAEVLRDDIEAGRYPLEAESITSMA